MQIPVMFGMLMQLLTNETVTAKQLAEKFELSTRSVYRYLEAISEAGVPVASKLGRYGGWYIMPHYKLKSVYFTKEELDRLMFDAKASSIQDDINKHMIDKLNGMGRALNDNLILRSNQLVVDTHMSSSVQEVLTTFRQALDRRLMVEIEYHSVTGETTRQFVEPYSLVLKNGIWFVYCYCMLRNAFRYFRVSRIAEYHVHNKVFLPRLHIADSNAIEDNYNSSKQTINIVLHVQQQCLPMVEEWLGIQCIRKESDKFTAVATVAYDDWLIRRIVGFGKGVTVVSPSTLIKDILRRCEDIADNYS